MKTEYRIALSFVSGLLIGSGATYLALKKYFEKKCDRDCESVEKAFTARIQEIEDEKDNALGVATKAIKKANSYEKNDEVKSDIFTSKDAMGGIIREIGSDDNQVDYRTYYPKNSPEAIASDGVPSEDDEEVVNTVNNKKETGNRRIRVISADDYGSIPGYDFKELYYYQGDGILVDDTEDIIDNPELLIGDALTKFGFAENDDKQICVRNDEFSCDYEIMKIFGSFGE